MDRECGETETVRKDKNSEKYNEGLYHVWSWGLSHICGIDTVENLKTKHTDYEETGEL